MDTYMVTLADRGVDKRIIVCVPREDDEGDVRDYLARPGILDTQGRPLGIEAPVVTGIRLLKIKRPVRGTVMPEVRKVPA